MGALHRVEVVEGGAPIPQDDGARAVVVRGDVALEVAVLQRMIFGQDGEALLVGVERGALGDSPGSQHSLHLEPEVEVESPGRVLLDDEETGTDRTGGPEGLRCSTRGTLLPVGGEVVLGPFVRDRWHRKVVCLSGFMLQSKHYACATIGFWDDLVRARGHSREAL